MNYDIEIESAITLHNSALAHLHMFGAKTDQTFIEGATVSLQKAEFIALSMALSSLMMDVMADDTTRFSQPTLALGICSLNALMQVQ